ncbi:MAG: thiamine pyrophosphate-dependent enzyme [Nitriliruptorales bacterium]|nr:thiamine pyrophosphate-dependent enzyme [Nitriliruptorales bacterium]
MAAIDPVSASQERLERCLAATDAPPRRAAPDDPLVPGSGLTVGRAVELFEDMVLSRAIDVAAREMKARDEGYYTIASAGHEDNVALGALLETTDPCFLHYRSGALMMARARKAGEDPVEDVLLGVAAAAADPVAGGRHKVWGSASTWVPPQTSTIASHLPKAVGTAFALDRARRIGVDTGLPADTIVCCSFGDASANHASALSAVNAARYVARRGSHVPILFVCEDNGLGISVPTPRGWIATSFRELQGLRYVRATGGLDEIWAATREAIAACRESRSPVFLHLDVVRLFAHAGSDVEQAYRDERDIQAGFDRDPLVRTAQELITAGAASADQLRDIVEQTRERVAKTAERVGGAPPLPDLSSVMEPLAPYDPEATRADAEGSPTEDRRREVHGRILPEDASAAGWRTMGAHINAALRDEMARRPELVVFGEDVGRKGGVYGVTGGLQETFGGSRVFDTLLDETTILGTAQGLGLLGLLPVAEIQYLAYLHNAIDQLRGEASSLSFFSEGAFTNPMVVRIAGFAYQKGFGGHFHNENAIGALRDIPGVVIAVPSRGDDAVRMLRGCLALARSNGRVVVFLEPIALYHERDLYEDGDGGWLTDYPPPGTALLPGEVGVHHPDANDLVIVTYANGVRMSLRAAARLREEGIDVRVLDLRWLAPLPMDAVAEHAAEVGTVLVVDECRATGGGIADPVIAGLVERSVEIEVASVRAADSFVPLGPAASHVLVGEEDILAAAGELLAGRTGDEQAMAD